MGKAEKGKKLALYTSLEVIIVVALLMLGGCFDWVNFAWDFSRWGENSFWSETVVKSLQYSLTMMSAMIYNLGRLETSDEEYFTELGIYREWLKIKGETFEKFIDRVLNPKIKKDKIREKITKKLYRLSKFAKDTWKLDFNDAVETGKGEDFAFSSKRSKKYYKRRCELERLRSDEYLDKNYMAISCRYKKVNALVFTPYLSLKCTDDLRYKVENESVKEVGTRGISKILSVILLTAALAMFALEPSANELLQQANGWIIVMIKYIVRIIMMIGNFGYGLWFGKQIFENNFTLPIHNRTEILKEYKSWVDANPETSEFQKKVEEIAKKAKLEYDQKIDEIQNKFNEYKTKIETQNTNP